MMRKIVYAVFLSSLVSLTTGIYSFTPKPVHEAQKSIKRFAWNAKGVQDRFGKNDQWKTPIALLQGNQESAEYVRDLVKKEAQENPELYTRLERYFETMMFFLGKVVYALELGNRLDADILGSQINMLEQAGSKLNELPGFMRELDSFLKENPKEQSIVGAQFMKNMQKAYNLLGQMMNKISRSFKEKLIKLKH